MLTYPPLGCPPGPKCAVGVGVSICVWKYLRRGTRSTAKRALLNICRTVPLLARIARARGARPKVAAHACALTFFLLKNNGQASGCEMLLAGDGGGGSNGVCVGRVTWGVG